MLRVVVVSTAAIAVMTAFSYAYSALRRQRFKQPPLLNELLAGLQVIPLHRIRSHPAGAVIHYLVGVLFIALFEWICPSDTPHRAFGAVVAWGALCGVAGVLGWYATYKLHPRPPAEISSPEFYLQIYIAHLFFGLGAYAGYAVLS